MRDEGHVPQPLALTCPGANAEGQPGSPAGSPAASASLRRTHCHKCHSVGQVAVER